MIPLGLDLTQTYHTIADLMGQFLDTGVPDVLAQTKTPDTPYNVEQQGWALPAVGASFLGGPAAVLLPF
eukprot:2113652-Ditylum_brightwellii.AAC.1